MLREVAVADQTGPSRQGTRKCGEHFPQGVVEAPV
jgi:hypothetical protein